MATRCKLLVAITVLVMTTSFVQAWDSNEPIGVGISADYFSKYIWRGQNLNDESVFQPAIFLSKYGFTGTVWSSLDMTSENGNDGEFTEVDYSLDYTAAVPGIDGINWSVGAINYDFPNTTFANTTEVYGGLTFTKLPLTPAIKIYRDVDEIDGTYYQLSIGKTFDKLKTWSDSCYCGLALGASVGYGNKPYNAGYFGADNGGLNDLTLTAGLPICFGSWTIKPSINYAMMLDSDVRDNTPKSDNLWAGVGISTSF